MEAPKEITPFQVANILISTILGVGILAFPRIVVESADTAAPLVTLLGVFIASVGLLSVSLLNLRFPGQSFFRYSENIVGKWIAIPINSLIIFFFLMLSALAAREFGIVVITSVLESTPIEMTIITMLMLAALSTRHDITTFSYIHQFYTPLILFPVLMIALLASRNSDSLNLQPIFGVGQKGYLDGGLSVAALLQGFFILSILTKSVQKKERVPMAALIGLMTAGGIYMIIVAVSLSVFGPEETKELMWPTLELAKLTSLPGQVLERLDAAFLAVWVVAVFTTLFSTYYLAAHGTAEIFRLRDHKAVGLFYLPFLFILANLPKNVLSMYELIEMVGRFGLLLTILYPLILLPIATIRKLGVKPKIDFHVLKGGTKNDGKKRRAKTKKSFSTLLSNVLHRFSQRRR